jgi:antitoxin StbD
MATLLTKHIVPLAEMCEPQKVLEKCGGEPVAILHGSALVGRFVPVVVISKEKHRGAAVYEVAGSLVSRNAITRPWTI